MIKYFCDGCKRETHMQKLATVDITNRRYDLCLERCYKFYGSFAEAAQREIKKSSEGFRERLKQLEESFWQSVGS